MGEARKTRAFRKINVDTLNRIPGKLRGLFTTLSLRAEWRPVSKRKDGFEIIIPAGSVFTYQSELAEEMGVSRETLRRQLKQLAELGEIEIIAGPGGSMIRVFEQEEHAESTQKKLSTGCPKEGHPLPPPSPPIRQGLPKIGPPIKERRIEEINTKKGPERVLGFWGMGNLDVSMMQQAIDKPPPKTNTAYQPSNRLPYGQTDSTPEQVAAIKARYFGLVSGVGRAVSEGKL